MDRLWTRMQGEPTLQCLNMKSHYITPDKHFLPGMELV
jgi:hypothetical protein